MVSSAFLADQMDDTALALAYATNASALKSTFNNAFWDTNVGMYRDNETSTLYPQDGNSIAVAFNLTETLEQAASVSEGLTRYWNEYGSVSPELPDNIAPFVGAFEVCRLPSRALCALVCRCEVVSC